MQLATAENVSFRLTNENVVYELVGAGEWTDENVLQASNIIPASDEWIEYFEVKYYTSLLS
ncbi:MAG: hypothetical protein ABIE43_05295 [Patescibacteria group bacterium]